MHYIYKTKAFEREERKGCLETHDIGN